MASEITESESHADNSRFTAVSECQNCVEEDLAVAYCKDCNRLLCDDCLYQHKKQRDTNKHEIEVSPFADEIRARYQCPDHKKNLDYFCSSCNKPVCDHCTKATCRDHKVLVRSEIESELKALIDDVEKVRSTFKGHRMHIDSVVDKNKTAFTQCVSQIETKFQQLAEALQQKKQSLLQELNDAKTKNDVIITDCQDFIDSTLEMLDQSIASTESLLESQKEAKLMVAREKTSAELQERKTYLWSTDKAIPRAWQLTHKPVNDFAVAFGELIPKPRAADIIISDLDKGILVGAVNSFPISIGVPDVIRKQDIQVVITHQPNDGRSRSTGTLLRYSLEEIEKNKWSVSFFLYKRGKVSISVTVCQVKAKDITDIVTKDMTFKEGDKVERGHDWKWDNQDGGVGNVGEVVGVKKKGWVNVKWKNDKKTYDYRFGDQDNYDLKLSSTKD